MHRCLCILRECARDFFWERACYCYEQQLFRSIENSLSLVNWTFALYRRALSLNGLWIWIQYIIDKTWNQSFVTEYARRVRRKKFYVNSKGQRILYRLNEDFASGNNRGPPEIPATRNVLIFYVGPRVHCPARRVFCSPVWRSRAKKGHVALGE